MNPSSIVVSGATGWLGKEICTKKSSSQLIGIARKAPQESLTCHLLLADLTSPPSVVQLLEQLAKSGVKPATFIHCAGLAHRPNETEKIKKDMWRVNDQGTANALEFCKRAGIKRFIYVSTIAGYDWQQGGAIKEDSKLNPENEYAKSKLAAEERVLTAPIESRIVRLSTVFGAGDVANFARLASSLRKRRFPIPGHGAARKSVIAIDTAASLILAYAKRATVPHRLVNLALPNAPSLREICDCFSQHCGFAQAPRLPLGIMKTLAAAGDLMGYFRQTPFDSEILRKLTRSTWVDTNRMRETFPETVFESFDEGLKRHAEYYRNLN